MTDTYKTLQKLSLLAGVVVLLCITSVALAQESGDQTDPATTVGEEHTVTFPVAELGNCASKSECKLYCDDASHREACYTFAQSHGLMNKDQVAAARLIVTKKGPGGCSTKDACRIYCEDSAHAD